MPSRFRLARPSRGTIPSYDVAFLAGPIRRTAVLRITLGLALVALLVAAVLTARSPTARPTAFITQGNSLLLVLDLSRSIDDTTYRLIRNTIEQVVATKTPAGLIVFSDTSYELVPPASRSTALEPMIRLFTPRPGAAPSSGLFAYPAIPWGDNFRGGTRISTGLGLAREVLARDRMRNATVVLLSDLETAASDLPTLTGELVRYRIERVQLKLVALFPSLRARQLFQRLVGRGAFVEPKDVFAGGRRVATDRAGGGTAPWLVAACAGVLLLLGANEWLLRRLEVAPA